MTDAARIKTYVIGGTKVTLDVLSTIAGGLPVPGLQIGITIANQILVVIEVRIDWKRHIWSTDLGYSGHSDQSRAVRADNRPAF